MIFNKTASVSVPQNAQEINTPHAIALNKYAKNSGDRVTTHQSYILASKALGLSSQ